MGVGVGRGGGGGGGGSALDPTSSCQPADLQYLAALPHSFIPSRPTHPPPNQPPPSPADCQHVNDFFRRAGVATLTMRELFEFVLDPAIQEGAGMDAELDRLMEMATR